MNGIYPFLVFLVVIFLYIHIISEYKVSEDLEVYEMDYKSNSNLQETCDVRQPVIFELPTRINFPSLETFKQPLTIKDLKDYRDVDKISIDSVELPCSTYLQLIKNDASSSYFSENNHTFIDESGLGKFFTELDVFLKPNNVLSTKHDILIASDGVCTPFRYHTDSRRYLYVANGLVKIKMTSKKFSKYLNEIQDFENLEFRSQIDVWNNSTMLDKIQFIEFDIQCGQVVYIPSFWWHSIKYSAPDTLLLECKYSSFANKVAFGFDLFRHYLQQHNIIRGYKCAVINKSEKDEVDEVEEDVIVSEQTI
jgi:hypothetical protein